MKQQNLIFRRRIHIIFTVLFCFVGVFMLIVSYASTQSIGIEAESGVKTDILDLTNDPSASGTRAIQFGAKLPLTYSTEPHNIGPLAKELNVASNATWGWDALVNTTGASQYIMTVRATSTQSQNNYFWSSSFVWANNRGVGGYIGLQTYSSPVRTKGIIFSMWDTTVAEADSGGVAQPFGGEGVGMQTAIPYGWLTGRDYDLSISKDNARSDSSYNWWNGTITDTTSGETKTIGKIRTPASWGLMVPNNSFLERYGTSNICTKFEPSSGQFRNIRASVSNSSYYRPTSVKIELREYSDCANVISSSSLSDGYSVQINPGTKQ